jgi:hypothetical protein
MIAALGSPHRSVARIGLGGHMEEKPNLAGAKVNVMICVVDKRLHF